VFANDRSIRFELKTAAEIQRGISDREFLLPLNRLSRNSSQSLCRSIDRLKPLRCFGTPPLQEAEIMDKNGRLPNGPSLEAAPTWSASPWTEKGGVRHTWDLVKQRYADRPELLEAFEGWARETAISDLGGTVMDWLQAESARGFFGGGGLAGRKASVIAAENTALRVARPKVHKEPLSEKLQIATSGTHAENLKQAALLADLAHDGKGIEPAVMNAEAAGHAGLYRQKSGIFPAQISVNKDADFPLSTGLHEIGHHVRRHLPQDEVGRVVALLKRTPEARLIPTLGLEKKQETYYLSDSELFSRASMQHVAGVTKHPELGREVAAVLGSMHHWEQFSESKEWTEASGLITLLLKKIGPR
jgi:hypothetical protein